VGGKPRHPVPASGPDATRNPRWASLIRGLELNTGPQPVVLGSPFGSTPAETFVRVGPGVGIRFPPGESPLRTCPTRLAAQRGSVLRSSISRPAFLGDRDLMALHEREKSGRGQFCDMTLHDCGMALSHPHAANANHRSPVRWRPRRRLACSALRFEAPTISGDSETLR